MWHVVTSVDKDTALCYCCNKDNDENKCRQRQCWQPRQPQLAITTVMTVIGVDDDNATTNVDCHNHDGNQCWTTTNNNQADRSPRPKWCHTTACNENNIETTTMTTPTPTSTITATLVLPTQWWRQSATSHQSYPLSSTCMTWCRHICQQLLLIYFRCNWPWSDVC